MSTIREILIAHWPVTEQKRFDACVAALEQHVALPTRLNTALALLEFGFQAGDYDDEKIEEVVNAYRAIENTAEAGGATASRESGGHAIGAPCNREPAAGAQSTDAGVSNRKALTRAANMLRVVGPYRCVRDNCAKTWERMQDAFPCGRGDCPLVDVGALTLDDGWRIERAKANGAVVRVDVDPPRSESGDGS